MSAFILLSWFLWLLLTRLSTLLLTAVQFSFPKSYNLTQYHLQQLPTDKLPYSVPISLTSIPYSRPHILYLRLSMFFILSNPYLSLQASCIAHGYNGFVFLCQPVLRKEGYFPFLFLAKSLSFLFPVCQTASEFYLLLSILFFIVKNTNSLSNLTNFPFSLFLSFYLFEGHHCLIVPIFSFYYI